MPVFRLRVALQILLVRLRFPLLLLGVVLLVSAWPWLRNRWDHLTRAATGVDTSVSLDTEYWCPMCPGVVTDWPAKCPVCHMDLVRRKKGEATPLPDGVVARMQLSPYRVQLAGIRTTPAEYVELVWEATYGGLVRSGDSPTHVQLSIDVAEADLGLVRPGLAVEVRSEAFPGEVFPGRVRELAAQMTADSHSLRAGLSIDAPRQELRPGMFVTARLRVPLSQRDRAAAEAVVESAVILASPLASVTPIGALESSRRAGVRIALHCLDRLLAIPTTAVIDTGQRTTVFVERMPGMFDAVEVALGRRCGDYFAVLGGLSPGERVVTSGAFLLDAETRLNPSLAASYFGAASRSNRVAASAGEERATGSVAVSPAAASKANAGGSSAEDQRLIAKQKVCPVTEAALGSMGPPVRVVVEGQVVFLCCKGCEDGLRRNAKKYLAKLPK